MYSDAFDSSSPMGQIEVFLDGQPVALPAQRRSPAAIRSFLEALALEQQRILWSFSIDGEADSSAGLLSAPGQFLRVSGQTIGLEQVPLQLVENAIHQTGHAHAEVQAAVTRVLINEGGSAHELWWNLTKGLKQPLLTVSLLPENICQSVVGVPLAIQLRRWQLQQLAGIIREVDRACDSNDSTGLSDALEKRVLPWLEALQESLDSLRRALLAAHDLASCES
jgi:hypothetical protein